MYYISKKHIYFERELKKEGKELGCCHRDLKKKIHILILFEKRKEKERKDKEKRTKLVYPFPPMFLIIVLHYSFLVQLSFYSIRNFVLYGFQNGHFWKS